MRRGGAGLRCGAGTPAFGVMARSDVPSSHPRFFSLMARERIVAGVAAGITSPHGLIAQGRGEAFDYLLGEKTHPFAEKAIRAAAGQLLAAQRPVISINGNVAALVPQEMALLGRLVGAPLEVNIFHTSKAREKAIQVALTKVRAETVLMPTKRAVLAGLDHNRRFIHPEGIAQADVVLVPLEDGDRCLALRAAGKEVITVDLNPLSRTARTASITIVDNLIRCLPVLIEAVKILQPQGPKAWAQAMRAYRHEASLKQAEAQLRRAAI
jgi:4-phosphopantoate---beta-alanine ligase